MIEKKLGLEFKDKVEKFNERAKVITKDIKGVSISINIELGAGA